MSKKLITSREQKGLQLGQLVLSTMNKAKLNQERAQRLIDNGEKFQEGIVKLINELSALDWTEKDGVICFSITSDGTTGPDWICRLEKEYSWISKWVKEILNSPDFNPTSGVTTEIAVLKGELFSDRERTTDNIRSEADKRKLQTPNAEVACLISEKFTNKEIEAMGLSYIVTMHKPVNDSDGGSNLLLTHRHDNESWMPPYYDCPGHEWSRDGGFAFVLGK